jgi:hypothetical protein
MAQRSADNPKTEGKPDQFPLRWNFIARQSPGHAVGKPSSSKESYLTCPNRFEPDSNQ